MKNFILCAAYFCVALAAGQNRTVAARIASLTDEGASFRKVAPLAATDARDADAEKVAGDATFATLTPEVTADIAAQKYEYLELDLPYNGTVITMQLYRVNIFAEGFHVDTDKASNIAVARGAHYRGIVKGDSNSLAAFNFFNNEMNGVVSIAGKGNIIAGKLQREGNLENYIIYADSNLKVPNTFKCSVDDDRFAGKLRQKAASTHRSTQTNRCVTVYFEIDHNLFLQNGSSTAATTNWMTSVFNNVQTLFANDNINVALRSLYIWTTADPYQGETSADYLMQFNAIRPVFDGDVGQLVGIDTGGLGGVAVTIAGICSDANFSYSDVDFTFAAVPTFSWTIQVITHELGHLLGSPHTHGCYWNGNNTSIDGCGTMAGFIEGSCVEGPIPDEGTIMSYCHLIDGIGINFLNGFGPQPAARIINHVDSSTCLGTDCINTCINTVASYSIIDTQPNAVTIQWTDVAGAGPWQVAYGPVNSTLTNWQTVTSPTLNINMLSPNQYYKIAVRPVCPAGITPQSNELAFATAADYCLGTSFTDTGGANGQYPNNQHMIRTFKPQNPGQHIIVTFSSFNVEADFDYLYVYDGPDVNAPLLNAYSGTFNPGTIESSAADGSLTFEFISDQFVTASGWRATVSCSALGTAENTIAGFAYYPNPAQGLVNLTARGQLEQVNVYNVAGQLLMQKPIRAANGTIDISSLADGVYFFRVTGSGTETNFRIIKQN